MHSEVISGTFELTCRAFHNVLSTGNVLSAGERNNGLRCALLAKAYERQMPFAEAASQEVTGECLVGIATI